jgi:hypothetical protein
MSTTIISYATSSELDDAASTGSYTSSHADSVANVGEFYIKKNALKRRSAEMFQVATDLTERKSEFADYAVAKYIHAFNACTDHGETEWDAIFDSGCTLVY